jgi:CubicO group peptidase (beta-lactamase class C family)
MRPWISSLAVAASLALAAPSLAAPPPVPVATAPDAALAARLDKVVDTAVAEQRVVGTMVLVARDGKVVYHRAAGLADREAGRPMREDAIFRFSSVTNRSSASPS